MPRKSLEQELLEAKLRFERAWERKKDDLDWKHKTFWPTVDEFIRELAARANKELGSGE